MFLQRHYKGLRLLSIALGAGTMMVYLLATNSSALFVDQTANSGDTVVADVLDPPTSLGAAANGNDIDLSWTATVDTYADGYNIYRSTSSGCCYSFIDSVVGQATTTYTDVGANPQTSPVFESMATASATNADWIVIAKPGGTVDGDLLIAVIGGEDDSDEITPPAGWTEIFHMVDGNGTFMSGAWYRIASGEPASFTFNSDRGNDMNGGILRYSNAHPTTPINASAAVGGSGNPTAPSVITTVAATAVLRVATLEHRTVADIDYPPGTTGRFEVDIDPGQVTSAADSTQASAGPTGAASFTGSSNDYIAATIAIAGPCGASYYYVLESYANSWTSVFSNEASSCQ